MKRTVNHILWEIEEHVEKGKAYLYYYIGNNDKPKFKVYKKKEISINKYKKLLDLMEGEKNYNDKAYMYKSEINFKINKIIKKDS